MTPSAHQPRLLFGRLLIILGIVLLVLSVWYFVPLVRPVDVWDFSPLVLALAVLMIGANLARLDKRILGQFGVSWKRDLVLSLAIGALGELSLWFYLSYIGINEFHIHLERLQEPGLKIALAIYRSLRPHYGHTLTVYLGTIFAFAALTAMWTIGAFALLSILRFVRRANSKQRTS